MLVGNKSKMPYSLLYRMKAKDSLWTTLSWKKWLFTLLSLCRWELHNRVIRWRGCGSTVNSWAGGWLHWHWLLRNKIIVLIMTHILCITNATEQESSLLSDQSGWSDSSGLSVSLGTDAFPQFVASFWTKTKIDCWLPFELPFPCAAMIHVIIIIITIIINFILVGLSPLFHNLGGG